MTFRPDVYPHYDKRWQEITAEIHKVFSGRVAINVINTDERLTFVDDLDVLLITFLGGLYIHQDQELIGLLTQKIILCKS